MTSYLMLLLLLSVTTFTATSSWKSDRKPRIYGDKLPRHVLLPDTKHVQKKIVVYHNFFRSHVQPTASDMLAMTWHKGAALAAQRWAGQCLQLTHDSPSGRRVHNFGSCGQNIFISTHQVPWFFAIKTWFLERHNFTYGSEDNSLLDVGHYTQLVWAATHKVGCGFAECKKTSRPKYFSYVCNYCPIGNHQERLGYPYTAGKPCELCKDQCRRQRFCTNSCPVADLWANCAELYRTWPLWLCRSEHTKQGKDRRHNCQATCKCQDKVK